jgi:hypothetical protein
MTSLRISGPLVAIALLAAGCVGTHEPVRPAVRKQRVETKWERETLKLLESRKISFFFQETQLTKVLAFLAELTGLTMEPVLDEGVDPPVTLRVNRMTLRCAFNWIATLTGTKWGLDVEGETICFGASIEGLRVPEKLHAWNKEKRNECAEALEKRRISFFFKETQLTKVLSFLADLTGIDFVWCLEEGIDPPVTLRVNRMAFENALDWIARLTRMKWGMRDEAICFHSGELETIPPWEWQERLKERIYVDFRDETIENVLTFLHREKGITFLDKIPHGKAPRITLGSLSTTVEGILDRLAAIFGTGSYAAGKEGVRFGFKDVLAVPEWKGRMYKTITEKRISVDFKDSKFTAVMAQLQRVADVSICISVEEGWDPKITFSARDVPVAEVLDGTTALAGATWIIYNRGVVPAIPALVPSASGNIWGAKVKDLDRKTAGARGLGNPYGALVVSVSRGFPADEAGLKKNDIILNVGKMRIMDAAELRRIVSIPHWWETTGVRILRGRSLMVVDVKLK